MRRRRKVARDRRCYAVKKSKKRVINWTKLIISLLFISHFIALLVKFIVPSKISLINYISSFFDFIFYHYYYYNKLNKLFKFKRQSGRRLKEEIHIFRAKKCWCVFCVNMFRFVRRLWNEKIIIERFGIIHYLGEIASNKLF